MTINTWPVTFLFSTRDSVVFIPPHPGCRSTFLFFTQPVSHCQSHFKSVSCFNLLNLIFPQLSDSFPLPLLPASHWIPPPPPPLRHHPCRSCKMTARFIPYWLLSTISQFVWSFHPSSSPCDCLIFLCFLPSWAQIREGIIFFSLVLFGGASKRRQRGR